MPQPLQNFYLFPVYQSREIYDAQPGDNADAPPWDGTRRLKNWVDPNPANVLELGIGLGSVAVYDAAIEVEANGAYAVGPDGQPKVSRMGIPVEEAKSLNFLARNGVVPTVADLGGGPAAEQMVRNAQRHQSIPLALPPGSRVRWAGGLNSSPVVYLAGEPLPEEQGAVAQANMLGQILDLLRKIAAKVLV